MTERNLKKLDVSKPMTMRNPNNGKVLAFLFTREDGKLAFRCTDPGQKNSFVRYTDEFGRNVFKTKDGWDIINVVTRKSNFRPVWMKNVGSIRDTLEDAVIIGQTQDSTTSPFLGVLEDVYCDGVYERSIFRAAK